MELKVPFLKPSEIDHMAGELVARYAKETGKVLRPPIDVDSIVERYLGLDFEVVDLKGLLGIPDVLGAVWFDDRVVRVDESIEKEEERLAFTVGHEIGHWQMHRPLYEMEKVTLPLYSFAPGQVATRAVVCRAGTKDRAEWQANRFSASLLMPEADVRATVRKLRGETPAFHRVRESQSATDCDPDFRDFANEVILGGSFLNVSNQAMRIRLSELGLVVDANDPQTRLL